MQEITTGLDLTQGSHFKNLVKLSLPIMLSNFMQTLYNLADTFWLGQIGEQARDAVSVAGMAFPVVAFFSSFGAGLVIAGTALVSRYRGAMQVDKIKELVGQFILVFILFACFFIVMALPLMNQFMVLLQTPTEIFDIAKQYMIITMLGLFFMYSYFCYQSFSHGLGDTVSPMKIQLVTLGLNVILDPIFIFGWLGFPKMGILGAAYATLFCRALTSVAAVVYFVKKTPQFIPSLKELKPKLKVIASILKIGLPASISQSMISFGFVFLQSFVNTFGTVVISINSIGNRIVGIFMMPAMGLSQGLAAIVGQNLGANNIARIKKTVNYTIVLVMAIMITSGVLMFLFGANITRIFIDDPEVIEVGERMFRIIAYSGTFFALLFVFIGVFNGAGKTVPAMMFNLTRLWVFRVPMVYILSGRLLDYLSIDALKNGVAVLAAPFAENPYDALWWSMVFSNIIAAIIAFTLYKKGKWKPKKVTA